MAIKRETFVVNIVSNMVIVAVILAVLAVSLVGTGDIAVSSQGKAIYRGDTSVANVSLMINVYWGTEYIEPMLDILDEYNVTTTFFVGGSWAAENSEILYMISERGHEIGNHGYNHLDHSTLNYTENQDEILVTEKIITTVCGSASSLFAPPSGAYGDTMFDVCEDLDYTVIMWSKDTIDWRDEDSSLVYTRATTDLMNGDLILMHPTAHTLEALPSILDYYNNNGFNAVTVSENIASKNIL
ncbi:MAG: polysaccharide deacetylase family protein [Bacillota bacterium]